VNLITRLVKRRHQRKSATRTGKCEK
jgi:hypothetical protein